MLYIFPSANISQTRMIICGTCDRVESQTLIFLKGECNHSTFIHYKSRSFVSGSFSWPLPVKDCPANKTAQGTRLPNLKNGESANWSGSQGGEQGHRMVAYTNFKIKCIVGVMNMPNFLTMLIIDSKSLEFRNMYQHSPSSSWKNGVEGVKDICQWSSLTAGESVLSSKFLSSKILQPGQAAPEINSQAVMMNGTFKELSLANTWSWSSTVNQYYYSQWPCWEIQ